MNTDSFIPDTPHKKSLRISWKEGIFANIMLVVMDYYLVPFALFLGARPLEVGLVVAVPQLLGSIMQLVAVRVLRWIGSRRRLLMLGAAMQVWVLIPLAFLAFSTSSGRIMILLVLISLFRILGNLIGTMWGSLMGDYLPENKMGKYLGWRSRIAGVSGLAGLCTAGIMLSYARTRELRYGFFLLFLGIAFCRSVSCFLFARMEDIPRHESKEDRFTFFMFLRRFRESNYVKFVLYVSSITFATQLAAPYFSVFMLRDLGFDYARYMLVHFSGVLAGLFAFPLWGKHADRVGNAKVLKTVSWLIPAIPLLWIVNQHPLYLVLIELFSGFVWGGFTIASANFVYDAVRPQKRVRCLAYFNLFCGVSIFAGASLGGFLAERLPVLNGSNLLTLFLISGVLRFVSHFVLSGRFQEVRKNVDPVSSTRLFLSVLGVRPMTGGNREWSVMSWLDRDLRR